MLQEWTQEDIAAAKAEGWQLAWRLEKVDGRNTPFLHIESVGDYASWYVEKLVKEGAEAGEPLCIKAITIIVKFKLGQ